MEINQITESIIGGAIAIHRALGPGLLESAYEALLEQDLRKRGHAVERQVTVPVEYEGIRVEAGFRLDMLIDRSVIVEVKATQEMHPVHSVQLLTYLRLMKMQVGLLINFHERILIDGVKRVVNDFRE